MALAPIIPLYDLSSFNQVGIFSKTQLIISLITLVVFYFLIKLIKINISADNDIRDEIINLNEMKSSPKKNYTAVK